MPNLRRGASHLTTVSSGGASVHLDGVRRAFGDVVALDDLDLELGAGELVALLGPSGCGKTTALRILAGFERPDAGRVLVDGEEITRQSPDTRGMGMVFQAYSLFPNLDLVDNVAFGLRMRGRPADARQKRARELLELVGLASAADRFPHQLSGGQQQRVALARALAIEPRVLLLDEPLSALDARVRAQLRTEIRRLQQELGITTLFVTHDQSEALSMADRVGVMNGGRLEQLDVSREIYRRPATPVVASFVGTVHRLSGTLTADSRVGVLGRELAAIVADPALRPGAVQVLLRPEALELVADPDGEATVAELTFLGSIVRVRAIVSDSELLVDVPSYQDTLAPGARVQVNVLADQALVTTPGETTGGATGAGDQPEETGAGVL